MKNFSYTWDLFRIRNKNVNKFFVKISVEQSTTNQSTYQIRIIFLSGYWLVVSYVLLIGSAQADPTVIPRLRGNLSDHPPPQRGRRPRNIVTVYTPCLHACFLGKFCHNFGANGLKRLHLDKSLNKIFTISTFLGTSLHKIWPTVVLICVVQY